MAILSQDGGAVNLPPDLLKDSSTPTNVANQFQVVIDGLQPNTTTPIQFAWVYPDKTVSQYSPTYNLVTSSESTPGTPAFSSADVSWANGFLKINWNGKDTTGADLKNIKQVNIWIRGGTFGATSVKTAHFFTGAGTKTIPLPADTYYIKLQAETTLGTLSAFSTEVQTQAYSKPGAVSNLAATWKKDDGVTKTDTLRVSFTFNPNLSENKYANIFVFKLTANGKEYRENVTVNKNLASPYNNVWYFDAIKNKSNFGLFTGQFTVEVFIVDYYGIVGDILSVLSESYSSPLDTPIITVAAESMGYAVSWNSQNNKPFGQIYIYENTGSGWIQVAQGTSNPIRVGTLNVLQRQVKAIFYDTNGLATPESNIVTVTPISVDPTDTTPPGAPTVTAGITTYNTIPITVSTADATTKGYKVRYKKTTDAIYATYDLPYGGASTASTLVSLTPNSSYNIGAAAYDQANNLSAFSSDITATTQTAIVPIVTGLIVSNLEYGVLAQWTAPADPPTPIYNYKIELYNSSNTLIQTDYSFSTNMSFVGLAASTTYYVKVYTIDIYSTPSAFVQSSNITINATGGASDGQPPLASPTPIVTALYGALEVKWTGLSLGTRTTSSNPDKVTYEVHIGTSSGFTTGAGTKALETDGTFAIIKTLPGTTTALTYGASYYIKIIAKDYDGAGPVSTQVGPTLTLQIDTGDIATNAVRANQIAAGVITADKVNAGQLLVDTIFTVGGKRATVSSATVSGGNIIYTTSANHGYTALSLVNVTGLTPTTFNISGLQITAVTATTFTVTNSVSATGSSTGTGTSVAIGKSAIKIDSSTDGVTNPFKFYSGTGIYANANTSFYLDTNGQFSLKDRLYFDGNTTLTVNGVINASSGNFSGALLVNNNTMKIGAAAGGAGNHGIYINANSYWYDNGTFAIGAATGSPSVIWNGTSLSVTGAITATSGSITGNFQISTGTLTTGVSASSGARVNINSSGIFAYDASNSSASTSIIGNAIASGNTFITTQGLIGNWTIAANTISNNGIILTAPASASSKASIIANKGLYFVGMQTPNPTTPAVSDIVLWAGQSSDGSTASFKVDAGGSMTSTAGSIAGWTIGTNTLTSGAMTLNSNSQTISFKGGYVIDNDITTISDVNGKPVTGSSSIEEDTPDSYYSEYGAGVSSAIGSTLALKASAGVSTGGALFLSQSPIGAKLTAGGSYITVTSGGLEFNSATAGAYVFKGLTNAGKKHLTYNGWYYSTEAEASAMLMVKSDGTLSVGRAIFKSGASEAILIPATGTSSHAGVGRVGDLLFSTSD